MQFLQLLVLLMSIASQAIGVNAINEEKILSLYENSLAVTTEVVGITKAADVSLCALDILVKHGKISSEQRNEIAKTVLVHFFQTKEGDELGNFLREDFLNRYEKAGWVPLELSCQRNP